MSINENIKDIYALAKKGANLELQELIMDLRAEVLTLEEENLELKKHIKAFEDAIDIKENLTYDGTKYWKSLPDGKKDGPFCQRCKDVNNILVRIHDYGDSWHCLECQSSVDK